MNTIYQDMDLKLSNFGSDNRFMIPAFDTDDQYRDWLDGKYSAVDDVVKWISGCGSHMKLHYIISYQAVLIGVAAPNDLDAVMFKLRWLDYIS